MKNNLMLSACLIIAFNLMTFAQVRNETTFTGKWSNNRGFEMTITKRTLKLGTNQLLRYVDITKVTDGTKFYLQIFIPENLNYFSSFASVSIDAEVKPAQMRIILYKTLADLIIDANEQGFDTFYRSDEEFNIN